jgi:predicted amidohydrolase YtcJ
MIEPYDDRPDTTGSLLVNASTLTSLAKQWSRAGFQVNIHAIGDLANRLAIDALEAALRDLCPAGQSLATCQAQNHRFRIEHAQIVHPQDQQRMRELGLIPSIQPTHATSDMQYAERRLGRDRVEKEAYRMQSFVDLHTVLGSDFPFETPNPFHGIYAAVTRKSPRTGLGPSGPETGWYIQEALTLGQALEGFTTSPARAAFMEGQAGVIRKGAFADWIVLDMPLDAMEAEDLRKVKVRETWVGGKLVYARNDEDEKEEL